jgi:hypothetical protein
MLTSPTIGIEGKFRGTRQVPNRLHVVMTSNYEHAVKLGTLDRRYVVLDVADTHASDKSYFDPLYDDLKAGGYGEFLHFLQHVDLTDWHPRQIIRTTEAKEQVRLSGDSVTQWTLASIEAGGIVGMSHGATLDLNQQYSTAALQSAYAGFCQQNRLRPVSPVALGKRFTAIFGKGGRLPASGSGAKRPMGYLVPAEDKLQEALDVWLRI